MFTARSYPHTIIKAITGILTGSGSLAIPKGITSISLTGAGGTGGDNSWYDAGQPYIAPSGYHAGTAGVLDWKDNGTYLYGNPPSPNSPPPLSYAGQAWYSYVSEETRPTYQHGYYYTYYISYWVVQQVAEYYDNAGQPYIAPSSGGGPTYGTNTTATLNGSTKTWQGGYGSGVVGTTSTQVLTSNGSGQTLTYSIGSGGSLSYSYQT